MEDGASDREENCAAVGGVSCPAEDSPHLVSSGSKGEIGSPMAEDCSLKSEDMCKAESNSGKLDTASFMMDVASPNSKMEVGSPNMEVNSPSMEVSSPKMDIGVKMEEGSAKMEEVAVKMGEVSVKSEDISSKSKENTGEQGSSKMEEVAVKMGEVSVKSEKLSVNPEEGAMKTEENKEIKVLVYRGSKCVSEGEVPEWLTVDILVRAIYNDRPGTKKPLICPFGSDAKTNAQRQTPGKSHPFSRENSYGRSVSSHIGNRPQGNTLLAEPSSSQSLNKPASSQSPGKPSTSQTGSKPSTSQSGTNKETASQAANTASSSSSSDRPNASVNTNQGKGKSSGGRIKGKSSVSLYKGKAPASEAASRATLQLETKSSCVSAESGNSGELVEGRLVEKNSESKTSEDDSTSNCIGTESNILSDNQESEDNSGLSVCADNFMGDNSRNDEEDAAQSDNLATCNPSCNEVTISDAMDKSESCSFGSNNKVSETFKKPTDPPKRIIKKPTISSKESKRFMFLMKQQEDLAKESFKKPSDPPKRTLKVSDPVKDTSHKSAEPLKVTFKKPGVGAEGVEKVTDDVKVMFTNPDESLKSTHKLQTDSHFMEKQEAPRKKREVPPLRVIRFISQRLSSGNTVYRVRATAVRGGMARNYHLVVKLCSSNAEITYYKKVAPRIPYVPRVLLCLNNVVVMDDLLHEGFRRPRGNFTPAQMTVAIDGLARMHTASVIALKYDPSLLEAFPQASKATESDMTRDLHLLADRVKAWSLPDADYYAARCHALAECVPYLKERLEPADTNMTVLLHGNVSPQNVFFLYDSRNPRLPAMASFVDFANVYWGHPALDVSLVTGPAGGFWEGYKIVLMSLLTRASGRMWLPQPEVKDCGETYAFALLRAVCSSVSGPAAKVLEAKLHELFPVFRQYSWLDFW